MVTDFLREWGLENKVFTITLDNALDNMIKVIKMSFIRNNTLRLYHIFHVRCYGHVLT